MKGLSAIIIKRLQSLLLVLFASACLALYAGTAFAASHNASGVPHNASAVPHNKHKGDSRGLELPVTGTFAPSAIPGPLSLLGSGAVTGDFTIQRFERRDLQVVAVGTLVATLKDSAGNVVRTVVKPGVALPLTLTAQEQGTATVTLPLGPVSVDAAGLVIGLNAITLTITDQGYLLETLLNDLATLLTNLVTGVAELVVIVIAGLVALLNQILGALV